MHQCRRFTRLAAMEMVKRSIKQDLQHHHASGSVAEKRPAREFATTAYPNAHPRTALASVSQAA